MDQYPSKNKYPRQSNKPSSTPTRLYYCQQYCRNLFSNHQTLRPLTQCQKSSPIFSFDKIPQEWIHIQKIKKHPITTIEEMNKILKNNNINLQLPITHNQNFKDHIKTLHQYFSFYKLPNTFIAYENQPDPDISLLLLH